MPDRPFTPGEAVSILLLARTFDHAAETAEDDEEARSRKRSARWLRRQVIRPMVPSEGIDDV